MRNLLRLCLGLTIAATALVARAAPSDPNTADVFVFGSDDGQLHAAFNVGAAEWTFGAFQAGDVNIFNEISVLLGTVGPFDDTTQFLLVNEAVNGLANPAPDSSLPPFSLVSLIPPPANEGKPLEPTVSISAVAGQTPLPDGGVASQTIAVSLEGTPGAQLQGDTTGLVLHWRIDGGAEQTFAGAATGFAIAANGVHTVEAWATQGVEETTPHIQASWTISGNPETADLDEDGLPDLVEILLGFSPFDALENGSNPWERDSDGDGVADLVEVLCGVLGGDPQDVLSEPPDSDGDGASDCQEGWRGTNPNDTQILLPDVPANSEPFEVERVLGGGVFDDEAQTSSVPVETLTMNYERVRWDYRPTSALLGDLGLSEPELPARLRPSVIEADLAAGQVPTVRVPATRPWVVRAEQAGEPRWAVRAWVPSALPLTPPTVTPILAAQPSPWTTAQEWIDAYVAYLQANLVVPTTVDLSPATGAAIALAEYAADLAVGASSGARSAIGEGPARPIGPISPYIHNGGAAPVRSGGGGPLLGLALCGDPTLAGGVADAVVARAQRLLDGTGPGNVDGLLAPLLADVVALHGDLANLATSNTVLETAEKVREPGLAGVAIFLDPSFETIDALPALAFAALLDPAADFDGDGRSNGGESLERCEQRTSMIGSDADADGIPDGADFCPTSAANTCLVIDYQEMDSDGDGVVDALDNCMNTANADQADLDGDLNGDACPRFARISRPRSNRRIFAGDAVVFESEPTALVPRVGATIEWDFAGVIPMTSVEDPGPVVFPAPGMFQVTLTSDDGTTITTDIRTITVMGLGAMPMVTTDGPWAGVEGQPIAMLANASSPNGPITSIEWDFGDGALGAGAAVAHTYGQQGDYTVDVRATDSVEQFAIEQTQAQVADSVPAVLLDWRRVSELGVQFNDLSTAYDGIAQRSWSFGDGSPVDTSQNPLHVYALPGSYDVTLTVVDGDGSLVMVTDTVEVTGSVPVPLLPGPWFALLLFAGLVAVVSLRGSRSTQSPAASPALRSPE